MIQILLVFALFASLLHQNPKDLYFHNWSYLLSLLAKYHQIRVFFLSLFFLLSQMPRRLNQSRSQLDDGRIGKAILILNNLFRS